MKKIATEKKTYLVKIKTVRTEVFLDQVEVLAESEEMAKETLNINRTANERACLNRFVLSEKTEYDFSVMEEPQF